MTTKLLMDARTTNGTDGPTLVFQDSVVYCDGTFDGATVTVEYGPTEDGPWFTADEVTFTAKGHSASVLTARSHVRATVSSAGASTSVSVWVG